MQSTMSQKSDVLTQEMNERFKKLEVGDVRADFWGTKGAQQQSLKDIKRKSNHLEGLRTV